MPPPQELLEWLEYEEWLKRQIGEFDRRLSERDGLGVHDASTLSQAEISSSELEVKSSIDELKDELFSLSTSNAVLEKILERFELNDSYQKIIFAQPEDSPPVR